VLDKEDIIFQDVQLVSTQMTLGGGGKISLNGDLNFLFFPQFDKGLLEASEGLKKYITNILGETGLAIEVSGTLKKPKYKMKPLMFSPLKKIKSFFEEFLSY